MQALQLDIAQFKKAFAKKKRMQWARPSIWYDADTPDTITREAEDSAVANVLDDSRRQFKHRTDIFTPQDRMHETRLAADYAFHRSMNIIRFLMWVLILSDEHSRRMLMLSGWRRADVAKIEPEFALISRAVKQNERQVQRIMATTLKPCPGKPENKYCDGHTRASNDLCWHCRLKWKTRAEYPLWLLTLVQDDDKEYRRQAQEALYHIEYVENDEAAA